MVKVGWVEVWFVDSLSCLGTRWPAWKNCILCSLEKRQFERFNWQSIKWGGKTEKLNLIKRTKGSPETSFQKPHRRSIVGVVLYGKFTKQLQSLENSRICSFEPEKAIVVANKVLISTLQLHLLHIHLPPLFYTIKVNFVMLKTRSPTPSLVQFNNVCFLWQIVLKWFLRTFLFKYQ